MQQRDLYRNIDKAGLTARLCNIQPVSWQWNLRGLMIHIYSGNFSKLRNRTEVGVIAQNARKQLEDIYPGVTACSKLGPMQVDYGMLAEIARAHLPYLAGLYQERTVGRPRNKLHDLPALLSRYEQLQIQDQVVHLLALVQTYDKELQQLPLVQNTLS